MTRTTPRPEIQSELVAALDACRRAVADYEAGLLDEHQLRSALFRGGLVVRDDEAWLLDISGGRWWRFDGIGMTSLDPSEGAAFTAAQLERFRRGIATMLSALDDGIDLTVADPAGPTAEPAAAAGTGAASPQGDDER